MSRRTRDYHLYCRHHHHFLHKLTYFLLIALEIKLLFQFGDTSLPSSFFVVESLPMPYDYASMHHYHYLSKSSLVFIPIIPSKIIPSSSSWSMMTATAAAWMPSEIISSRVTPIPRRHFHSGMQHGHSLSRYTNDDINGSPSKIDEASATDITTTGTTTTAITTATTATTATTITTITPARTYCDISYLPYESALKALKAYRKMHGNLVIPRGFVVPATKDYPTEWHGTKLAQHIYNMKWWQKHIAQHSHRVSQLNQLGFVWERLQPEWNLFMEGLVHYKGVYGNVMVPASFVIPHNDHHDDDDGDDGRGDDDGGDGGTSTGCNDDTDNSEATTTTTSSSSSSSWPKATWGYPLGNAVYRVRFRNDFVLGENAAQRKHQLDGLGFVWDVSEHNFLKFFRALRIFDKLERYKTSCSLSSPMSSSPSSREHNTIRVPSKFIVPSGMEHGWPKELWGFQLGAKCMAVRQKELYVKNHPDRKRALEEIGFRWSGNATLGWLDVVHAAAIYSQMHGRTLNVPFDFCVPAPPSCDASVTSNAICEDVWPWPEQLWGLRLGQRLKDVRLKGAYLKGSDAHIRRAQLDALGFVWNPKRGRRKRALGGANGKDSLD